MLDRRTGAGSDRLKSMHLVLLAYKSSWRPRKESCIALKLIWRLVNTVSKEGPEVYRYTMIYFYRYTMTNKHTKYSIHVTNSTVSARIRTQLRPNQEVQSPFNPE